MLSKENRMKKTKDFALMSTKGRSIYGPLSTMRVRASGNGLKVSFVVSTKVFKKSVDRNRARRRFRAAFRELLDKAPQNFQIMFILKPESLKAEYSLIKSEFERMLSKIPEAMVKPVKISPRAKKEMGKGKLQIGARFVKPKA